MGCRKYKSNKGQYDFHSANIWNKCLGCLVKVTRPCLDFMMQGKLEETTLD